MFEVRSRKGGGFRQVISRGHEGEAIEITMQIEMDIESAKKKRLVTYHLRIEERVRRQISIEKRAHQQISIEERARRQISITKETLRFKRSSYGAPYHFIRFKNGRGEALAESIDAFNQSVPLERLKREEQELDHPYTLALKGLGQFRRFEAASQLRELIENWEVSDFHISDARVEPDAALAENLNAKGDNIALYAQYLREDHPKIFKELVRDMRRYVPGISKVKAEDLRDGRVALRFWERAFNQGFIARAVSDGTIKMFAYLALLRDPHPHPLLCVEEPENQLYPTLLGPLAEQFRLYAKRRAGEGQVIVTTHSPDFLNSVPLESIYFLVKKGGATIVTKASDDKRLCAFVREGDPPGALWRQGMFDGVDP